MDITQKPEYIRLIEKEHGLFSSVDFGTTEKSFDTFLSKRSLTLVWSEGFSNFDNRVFVNKEKIYKTKQGFYLYLLIDEDIINLKVYYKQEQLSELTIFIGQLIKQYKNDTTNE